MSLNRFLTKIYKKIELVFGRLEPHEVSAYHATRAVKGRPMLSDRQQLASIVKPMRNVRGNEKRKAGRSKIRHLTFGGFFCSDLLFLV